jgi:hypothetical protein
MRHGPVCEFSRACRLTSEILIHRDFQISAGKGYFRDLQILLEICALFW